MSDNSPPNPAEAPRRLTRHEAARTLGCSVSTVRRLEYLDLHPIADERGVVRFDPAEVAAAAQKRGPQPARAPRRQENPEARRGRLAARVFMMFAGGRSIRQIVVTAKVPPDVVRSLYHEWGTSLQDGEWARLEREMER